MGLGGKIHHARNPLHPPPQRLCASARVLPIRPTGGTNLQPVDTGTRKSLHRTSMPVDLDEIDMVRLAQSKVERRAAMPLIAAAVDDFVVEALFSTDDTHPTADPETVLPPPL